MIWDGKRGGALVVASALAFALLAAGEAHAQGASGENAAAPPNDEADKADGADEEDIASATPDADGDYDGPLKVVVAGSAPFVVGDEGTDGLAVDVWDAVADKMGAAFELERAASVADALARVAAGTADVAVGPISITAERARTVSFSQPYYQAHLALAAPPDESAFARIRPFLTIGFLSGVGGLLVVLLIVGLLIWLAERRANPDQFPTAPVAGIGNGIWIALVTMTTVGYGDRVPVTPAGRVVAGVWMLISMLIAGSLIAFMSTALTLSQIGGDGIDSADDLPGRRVAVVAGTTAAGFVDRRGGRPVPAATIAEAVASVGEGRAAAIVADGPSLGYYLREHTDTGLVLAGARYEPTGYGFAVPLASPLQHRLSLAVLEAQNSGLIAELVGKWLERP